MGFSATDGAKMVALKQWASSTGVDLKRLKASDLEKARDATGISPVDVERLAFFASTYTGTEAPTNALAGEIAKKENHQVRDVFGGAVVEKNGDPKDGQLREQLDLAQQYGWKFSVDRTLMRDKPISGQQVLDEARNGHTVVARRVNEGWTVASSDGGGVHYKDKEKQSFSSFAELQKFLGGFEGVRNTPASALPQASVALTPAQLQALTKGLLDAAKNVKSHAEDANGKIYDKAGVQAARALFAQVPAEGKAVALAGIARINVDLAADLGGLTQMRFDDVQRFPNRSEATVFADPSKLSAQDVATISDVVTHLAGKLSTRGSDANGTVYETGGVQAARALFAQLSAGDKIAVLASVAGKSSQLAADLSGQSPIRLEW